MRRSLIRKALRHRYAVTLRNNEGTFAGVLVDADRDIYIFDACTTVPVKPGETPDEIPGRVYIDRSGVAYLQELTP